MPPIPAYLLASGITAAAGSGINFAAQSKLISQAKKASKKLRKLNANTMSQFQDLQSFIEGAPELDIDRSLFKDLVSFSQDEAIRSEGRATGDEQIRDNIRQTTANATANALATAGSGADALGAISNIQSNENAAFRDADIVSIRNRNAQIQRAKDRLFAASRSNAIFNHRADLAEFSSRQQQRNQQASFRQNLIGLQNQFGRDEISQAGAIASAKAARMAGLGGLLGSSSKSLLDLYSNEQNNEFLSGLFGDSGSGEEMDFLSMFDGKTIIR